MRLLNDMLFQGGYLFRTLIISILFICAFWFVKDNHAHYKEKLITIIAHKWILFFLVYSAYLFTSTLIARPRTLSYKRILEGFALFYNGHIELDVIENILLFVPYSFFFLKAFKTNKPCIWSFVLSLGTSFAIELCQLVFWLGFCQLSDIMFNSIGGIGGWLVWLAVEKLKK